MLASSLLFLALNTLPQEAETVNALQVVGQAKLKVMLFPIFNAKLYSDDGRFDGITPPLALDLLYLRDIKRDKLIEHTRKEWQRLGRYQSSRSEAWLSQLADLWPDVNKGDRLTVTLQPEHSSFYFNGQPLGSIEQAQFGPEFFAIWLSPNARYPEFRNQLIGR